MLFSVSRINGIGAANTNFSAKGGYFTLIRWQTGLVFRPQVAPKYHATNQTAKAQFLETIGGDELNFGANNMFNV